MTVDARQAGCTEDCRIIDALHWSEGKDVERSLVFLAVKQHVRMTDTETSSSYAGHTNLSLASRNNVIVA